MKVYLVFITDEEARDYFEAGFILESDAKKYLQNLKMPDECFHGYIKTIILQ